MCLQLKEAEVNNLTEKLLRKDQKYVSGRNTSVVEDGNGAASESFCWNPNPPPVPHLSVRPKASRMAPPVLYIVQQPCIRSLLCGPRPCIRSAEPWAKSRPHTTSSLSRHPHPPTQTSCPWHFAMPEFPSEWTCRNPDNLEST